MIGELSALCTEITFCRPNEVASISVFNLLDTAHVGNDSFYGQTGISSGIRIRLRRPSADFFHTIVWRSQKQRRVSYSFFGAEILAAAASDDRGYEILIALFTFFSERDRFARS